jgi:uncharacterized protein (DUF58 family)
MAAPVVLEHIPVLSGLRDPGSERLIKKRIYIFPTRQGLVYLFMLTIMLLGAANYNNSMAYILTFLLGSIFMVVMLHTYRNLRGLIIYINPAAPVFAGETAAFPLLIDNRSGARRTSIVVSSGSEQEQNREAAGTALLNVPAAVLHSARLRIPAIRRGHLQPGQVSISSTFPAGLLRAWSYFDSDQVSIVYPCPKGVRRLPDSSEYTLEEQSGLKTGTDDFTGFNSYRPGDSIRNINWKIYAREQGLLVKKFSGSGSDRLLIQWDQCAHINDVEGRLAQLSLWVMEADRQEFYYGLEIPSAYIGIDHGEAHRHLCLKALAEHGSDQGKI